MRIRIFEENFPICSKYGMTEEQFWNANPRIIKVWENAWKEKVNHENYMNYILGSYVLSAVSVAIGSSLEGKKFKGEYLDKPHRIFELTEKEKQIEQQKALKEAISFFNGIEADIKAGDTVGRHR